MNDFDARARTWDADPAKVERARIVAGLIRRDTAVSARSRVFEYGCGTGLLGFALQPHVRHVTLADSSAEMIAVVREKMAALGTGNVTALHLDLTRGEAAPAEHDLVCTLLMLHHVPDVGRALAAFRAILAPGGTLCIADLDAEDGSFHGPGMDVHHGFDREALRRRLLAAGFQNVRIQTAFAIEKKVGGVARSYPVFLAIADA
jgi:SAM-dependent methyltransferase